MTAFAMFIGGPVDGRRKVMERMPEYWHVETRPSFADLMRNPPPDPAAKLEVVRHTYRAVPIGVPGVCLYVHSSVQNVIGELVNGYRVPGNYQEDRHG